MRSSLFLLGGSNLFNKDEFSYKKPKIDPGERIYTYIFYWVLNLTWGCIMTAIGLVVALVMLITFHRPHRLGPAIYFEVGKGWGGCELGLFFLVSRDSSYNTKCHELGHGWQNCKFGPIMPFIVSIPSAYRYWMIRFSTKLSKKIYAWSVFIIAAILVVAPIGVLAFSLDSIILTVLAALLSFYDFYLLFWALSREIDLEMSAGFRYDDVWFEEDATYIGIHYARDYINN